MDRFRRNRSPLRADSRTGGGLLLAVRAFVAIERQLLGQNVLEREAGVLALAPVVVLEVGPLLGAAKRLDRERDPTFLRVDVDDLGLDVVTGLVERLRLVDALGRKL